MKKQQFLGAGLHTGLKSKNVNGETILNVLGFDVFGDVTTQLGKTPMQFISIILRPLSDLTKLITHNGETFVPIVELAKIVSLKLKWVVTFEDGQCYIGTDIYQKQYTFFYSVSEQSFYINSIRGMKLTPYQFKLFQKLIEWHFNLMDESEPFIPVTAEFNPYK